MRARNFLLEWCVSAKHDGIRLQVASERNGRRWERAFCLEEHIVDFKTVYCIDRQIFCYGT